MPTIILLKVNFIGAFPIEDYAFKQALSEEKNVLISKMVKAVMELPKGNIVEFSCTFEKNI